MNKAAKVNNPENISPDNKDKYVYDAKHIQIYNEKQEIKVDDMDRKEEIYDDHNQKMVNGQWMNKTRDISTGNRNIGNLGNEYVQSNKKRTDIVIGNVVNDDQPEDHDKDKELQNENDTIGYLIKIITTKGP